MSYSARTDLALEAREIYLEDSENESEIDGVDLENLDYGNEIQVTRVKILNKNGESALGKKCGTYITLEFTDRILKEQTVYEEVCKACASELSRLTSSLENGTVLVAGLGNRNITADALGPKVTNSLLVTRHLLEYMPEEIDSRLRSVCAISPGVLGLTGVETVEIIKGIADKVKPSLIIVIDALCSRSMHRINNTIQLSNTGITPGAGVGNHRNAITHETLGVPVIAIGLPTVVDAATISADTIDLIIENLKAHAGESKPIYKMLEVISAEDKYSLIKQILTPHYGDFVVCPKEVDSVINQLSSVIANGINIALHQGLSTQDIDKYK